MKDITTEFIKQNLFICIRWLQIRLYILKFSIFVCLLLFVCTSRFALTKGKWSDHDSKNCSEIKTVTTDVVSNLVVEIASYNLDLIHTAHTTYFLYTSYTAYNTSTFTLSK